MATAAAAAEKEINPHIPGYISAIPRYLKDKKPGLERQRLRKNTNQNNIKPWYNRGAKTFQADRYRKGACENCGARTHNANSCTERPRKVGARFTNKRIAPDEKIEIVELDYDCKRDPWNGYDPAAYQRNVVVRHEAQLEARRKYLEEKKNCKEVDDEDGLKVDESKNTNFARVRKRVCSNGGGSTGTIRNLRQREDTAKYLLNLDLNSAYYDPKSRSMREDPLPDADPNEKFYAEDNRCRMSGQASEFKRLNAHALEAFGKGQDIDVQGAPSQAELQYRNSKIIKEKKKSRVREKIMDKYGNDATEEEMPRELLLGQSEWQVEYDRAGRIIQSHTTL